VSINCQADEPSGHRTGTGARESARGEGIRGTED